MSEFTDTFVKFSNLCPKGGAFDSLFCPEGRVFVHNDCSGGRGFAPFKSRPEGMVLDETDTYIRMPCPGITTMEVPPPPPPLLGCNQIKNC